MQKKFIFGHILAVEVLLAEIGENKKMINIEMVKNKAYKCLQLLIVFLLNFPEKIEVNRYPNRRKSPRTTASASF